ncbi:SCAN domain-containing protein 3-like [Stegodyphus dumicola]|uniref:SCAN domain-containing protein 3-like n=1 Tax=Stegodyphus dumicola TaxID=202533 RepID=UPI0015A92EA8|nr:SCAN domain-containing protein 3-like [Stegodyphus dumicola]
MWPDLKIVHGKPRHSQIQGSVERANQDIENMLSSWLESNHTSKWSERLRFAQLMKKRAFHEGIKCSPYEAMFGTLVKFGLKTYSFPNHSIEHLRTEEELQAFIETVTNASENTNSGIENVSNMDNNDLSKNYPPSEVNFKTQKENEAASAALIHTDILCRQEQVRKHRMSAKEGLELQAKKMLKVSNLKFSAGVVGDTVKLRIPNVDRARSEPRNLFAVILEAQNEEFYHLGTTQGRLSQLYTRNQFTIFEETFVLLDDVPDLAIPL